MNAITALSALALVPTLAACHEESVPLDLVPTPVRSAVMTRFGDATLKGASMDREAFRRVYEVSLDRAGRNIDVTSTPAGKLTLIEIEITRAELPAPVASLLETRYPAASWQIVEEVRAVKAGIESLSFYEILLVDAKKQPWEVQAAADGSRVIKVEKKRPGDVD